MCATTAPGWTRRWHGYSGSLLRVAGGGDMTDGPDKRVPGEHHPYRAPEFPKPWRITVAVSGAATVAVSGWFCPTDQWPEQQSGEGKWPGHDPDTDSACNDEPDDEDGDNR